MRRPVVKPADEEMKFFTRALYKQFNSSDADEADEADARWENAVAGYRRHLRSLKTKLPTAAFDISKACFHDARLLQQRIDPDVGLVGVVEEVRGAAVHTSFLWYALFDKIHIVRGATGRPFAKSNVRWLYDEFDVARAGGNHFIHRILLSDGRIVVVPFTQIGLQRFQMDAAPKSLTVMQSA